MPATAATIPAHRATASTKSELTLDVAIRLEKLLKKQPGVEVVMTRDTDVFVPLEERTAIANREGADLFLSIHANASRNPQGARRRDLFPELRHQPGRRSGRRARELGVRPRDAQPARHRQGDRAQQQARRVARLRRNRAAVDGSAPRPRNKQLRDLGVKQAPFVVLIGASMPSVLAEISFVTHKQEGHAAQEHRLPPADRRGAVRSGREVSGVVEEAASGGVVRGGSTLELTTADPESRIGSRPGPGRSSERCE